MRCWRGLSPAAPLSLLVSSQLCCATCVERNSHSCACASRCTLAEKGVDAFRRRRGRACCTPSSRPPARRRPRCPARPARRTSRLPSATTARSCARSPAPARARRASRSAAGTTRLTSPHSSAVRASISSPVSSSSIARLRDDVARDADRGRRAEDAGVDAGQAELRVIRRHGEIAHRHELAAGRGGRAVHARDHRLRDLRELQHHPRARVEQAALPRRGRCARASRSGRGPAQNARPAPASTTTRTLASPATASSAASSAAIIAVDSGLKRSPRLSVSVHTPSRVSASTKARRRLRRVRSCALILATMRRRAPVRAYSRYAG